MPDSFTDIEAPLGIIVTDANGIITAVSEGVEKLGIDNLASGKRLHEIFPVNIPPSDDDTYPKTHVLKKDNLTFGLTVYKCLENVSTAFLIVVKRTDDAGKSYSFEQLNKILCLNEIIAGIAHEIRNPLTYVSGYLQMLYAELDEADPKKSTFKMLTEESERISKIVNELLDFSSKRTAEKDAVDLQKILEDVLLLVEYQLRVENIEIVKSLEANWVADSNPEPIIIFADPCKLKQLFLNLLQNARDAMPNGGKLYITLHHVKGNNVEIEVRDTGCGIPQHNLNKVFDPFYTRNGNSHRTGLGLFVCKKIIEEHNGSLSLKSTVGEGTVIAVSLPLSTMPKTGQEAIKPVLERSKGNAL